MFERILVGLSHGVAARRALAEGADLAGRHGARLSVVTAVPLFAGLASGTLPAMATAGGAALQLEDEAVALQEEATRDLPLPYAVETSVRWGAPYRVLLDRIVDGGHDLLVIGESDARRFEIGARLSRRLRRRSPIPVLAVAGDGATALYARGGT